MEAQTVAQLQRPGQSVLLDGMALDHLWLRLPFGVDAVKRIEHEIGGVSRRPRPGDDRIQHRKIRDPDKDEGFRAVRSPQSRRRAERKCRRRRGFEQIASSHTGFSQLCKPRGHPGPGCLSAGRMGNNGKRSRTRSNAKPRDREALAPARLRPIYVMVPL